MIPNGEKDYFGLKINESNLYPNDEIAFMWIETTHEKLSSK